MARALLLTALLAVGGWPFFSWGQDAQPSTAFSWGQDAQPSTAGGPAAGAVERLVVDFSVDDAAQRKVLEDNVDIMAWRGVANLSDSQVRRLARDGVGEIRRILATRGFFRPEVSQSTEAENEGWRVHYRVLTGPRARVASVQLQLHGAAATQDQARWREVIHEGWRLPTGQPFDNAGWETAKSALLRPFHADRYPAAHISHSLARVDPDSDSVALEVTVDSGPAFRFGPTQVEVDGQDDRQAALRLDPIRVGEEYDAERLEDYRLILQDYGAWDAIMVRSPIDAALADAVPVEVELRRRRRWQLSGSAGVSTDVGVRARAVFNDHDLFESGWWLRTALSLDPSNGHGLAELQAPVDGRGRRFSAFVSTDYSDVENLRQRDHAAGLRRSHTDGQRWRIASLTWTDGRERIPDQSEVHTRALVLDELWRWRELDSRVFPTRGHMLELQLGGALRSLGSSTDFLRLWGRAIHFLPLGRRDQLILRGEMGLVAARDGEGVPQGYLFRTGGDLSVRGHDFQSIGVDRDGAVTGGRQLVVGSAEYVHWLNPEWGLAGFVDAGNAGNGNLGDGLAWGVGVGGRWRGPVGPVGVDLAFDPVNGGYRLHFRIGAWSF